MAEYSRLAKGNFTAAGTTAFVALPFQPDYVELWNYSNIKTAGTHKVTRAWWDNKFIDTATSTNPTMLELYSGSVTSVVFDQVANTAANPGINSYAAGQLLQYGPSKAITTVTGSASPTIVTTTAAHGYSVGDTVIMEGIALNTTNNMQLLNGIPFTITAVGSTTTFSIQWDSSGSQYSTVSPTAAIVKKVLYPFLYLPEQNFVASVTLAANASVVTTMYHNFEVGQEVAFRIPKPWGITQLNSLPDLLIPGSPIYGYVVAITDNWTFVVNINTTAYTAYTNNFTMGSSTATVPTLSGLTFPQVISVGDVNTGGLGIYVAGTNGFLTTSPLYPPPNFPTSTNRIPTINGPAVKGGFVNNTSQGFTIGAGVATADTTATIMVSGNQIYWHAYLHDFGSP